MVNSRYKKKTLQKLSSSSNHPVTSALEFSKDIHSLPNVLRNKINLRNTVSKIKTIKKDKCISFFLLKKS